MPLYIMGRAKRKALANPRERRQRYIIDHLLGVRVLHDKYGLRMSGVGIGCIINTYAA